MTSNAGAMLLGATERVIDLVAGLPVASRMTARRS
jgi:hypothetical protein